MFNSTLYLKNHKQRLFRWLMLAVVVVALIGCGLSSLAAPTPSRTPLPTLTPTPVFERRNARQVVRAIQAAGLECAAIKPMALESFDVSGVSGWQCGLPSICPDCSGLVLSFKQPAALAAVKAQYITQNSAQPAWVFVKDNILLWLDGRLTREQALQYGAALTGLR